jgi:hypothetical protein
MHIQTDRALIPAGARATRYLHVAIAAPSAPPRTSHPRPAADVAFVLDRSGSMDGSKLTMARRAVAHALRLLTRGDRFALVVYDDAADVVQPTTAGTHEAVTLALRRLDEVVARGSTNLGEGWMRGADALRTASVRGSVADAGPTPAGDVVAEAGARAGRSRGAAPGRGAPRRPARDGDAARPRRRKARFMASYCLSESRDVAGKARRNVS